MFILYFQSLLHECVLAVESTVTFDWDDYFQKTRSSPLPDENLLYFQPVKSAFLSVLLDSWIEAETGPNTYWPTKIIDVYDCGLCRLQWYGLTEEPVWRDLSSAKFFPLWFAKENDFQYKPPEEQCELVSERLDQVIASFHAELSSMSSTVTASDLCFKKRPLFEEIIANCSTIEVLDSVDPRIVHVASIINRKIAHIYVSYCDTFEWISIHSWRLRPLQWCEMDGSKFGCFYGRKIFSFHDLKNIQSGCEKHCCFIINKNCFLR